MRINMDKRVYGVIGISSIMANWTQNFTGYQRVCRMEMCTEVIKL